MVDVGNVVVVETIVVVVVEATVVVVTIVVVVGGKVVTVEFVAGFVVDVDTPNPVFVLASCKV